jgi:hypothetical protein
VRFETRAQWGARPPSDAYTPFVPGRVEGVVIHHGASPTPTDHSQCAAIVRAYQRAHMADEYIDIAYNHLVCPHSYVFQGRGRRNESGANGTVDTNERFLALCYIGNGTTAVREPAVEAYRELIAHVRERYPKARRIIGHRDIKATSCPGDALYETMRSGVLDPDRALEYYVVVRKRRPFTPSRVVSFARRGGGRGEALARGTDWVLLANRDFRVSFRLVKRRRAPAVGRRL